MTQKPSILARSLPRLRISVLALQWGGNLLAFLLAILWLEIPDSHAWQFAFSMLAAAALALGFCWIQITTFARLRPTQPANLWLRSAGLALVALLWFLLAQWINSGRDSIPDYAYLWNSKLSPGMRIAFSPARLIDSLNIALDALIWAITGLLLPITITLGVEGLRRPSWCDACRPWRRILYWLAVFAFCIVTTQLTAALVDWTPGSGVSGEIFSVALRLIVAWTTDILLWCLLLALTAAWMEPAPAPVPPPAPAPEPSPAS